MDLERYRKLKAAVDQARRDYDRAVGARDVLQKRLKDEFGCGSLADAEREQKKLRAEAERLEGEFDQRLVEFEEEWAESLGGKIK